MTTPTATAPTATTTPTPPLEEYTYTVVVAANSRDAADRVMSARVEFDEDYGDDVGDYSIEIRW